MSDYLHLNSWEECNEGIPKLKRHIEHWTPWDLSIDHCLSEKAEPQFCGFIGDKQILTVVIVCNAIKIVCMLIVAFGLTRGSNTPMLTAGDAISSFLQEPDAVTEGCCLLNREDVGENALATLQSRASTGTPATRRTLTWSKAASNTRWCLTIGSMLLAVLVVVAFFGYGYAHVSEYAGESIASIGFGKPRPAGIITDWPLASSSSGTISTALIANIPQLVLSFLYVNVNSLFTCMWLASEWNDFALERKSLRVSLPRGDQRSTYFLQLPWRVGIPLILIALLLHWLVSESIFLAIVGVTNWQGTTDTTDVVSLGFSLEPMLAVMIAAVLLCIGTILLGRLRKLPGDGFMPLAGSCSLAIAAACHPPVGDEKLHLTGVMWGAVGDEQDVPGNGPDGSRFDRGTGHCSFTSRKVSPIQEGRVYA
jgi:hypothetical protein